MSEEHTEAGAEETSGPPAQVEAEGGLPSVIESRTVVALSYLSSAAAPWLAFVPLVPLVFPNMKRSAWMRFHAWNALLLSLAASGVVLVLFAACLWLAMVPVDSSGVVNMLTLVRYVLLPSAAAIFAIHLAYEAIKRRPAHIPLLSDWAHALAGDEPGDEEPPEAGDP